MDLDGALNELPVRQRWVYELSHGLTATGAPYGQGEIARMFGVSVNDVRYARKTAARKIEALMKGGPQ